MSIRTIHEDEYISLTYDSEHRLVVFRRTSKGFSTAIEAAERMNMARALITMKDLAHHVFLMDVREAPMRSDPEFERATQQGAHPASSFGRAAVLVKTAVGKLQMTRIAHERGEPFRVFDNEQAALAYLLAPLAAKVVKTPATSESSRGK